MGSAEPSTSTASVDPISTPPPSAIPLSPTLGSPDALSLRASALLRDSSGADTLASTAIPFVSLPALRHRTAALLTTPALRAALVSALGDVSLLALLTHPDSAEHGLAIRALGLDAALADSLRAARDATLPRLAAELYRDPLVRAAVHEPAGLARVAALLAADPATLDTAARRAAELYVERCTGAARVRAAASAEAAVNFAGWAMGGARAFLAARAGALPSVSVSWPQAQAPLDSLAQMAGRIGQQVRGAAGTGAEKGEGEGEEQRLAGGGQAGLTYQTDQTQTRQVGQVEGEDAVPPPLPPKAEEPESPLHPSSAKPDRPPQALSDSDGPPGSGVSNSAESERT